jgi:hypothetical protein
MTLRFSHLGQSLCSSCVGDQGGFFCRVRRAHLGEGERLGVHLACYLFSEALQVGRLRTIGPILGVFASPDEE